MSVPSSTVMDTLPPLTASSTDEIPDTPSPTNSPEIYPIYHVHKLKEAYFSKWLDADDTKTIVLQYRRYPVYLVSIGMVIAVLVSLASPTLVVNPPVPLSYMEEMRWPEFVERGLAPMLPADPIFVASRRNTFLLSVALVVMIVGMYCVFYEPNVVLYKLLRHHDNLVTHDIKEAMTDIVATWKTMNSERAAGLACNGIHHTSEFKRVDHALQAAQVTFATTLHELDLDHFQRYERLVNTYYHGNHRNQNLKAIVKYEPFGVDNVIDDVELSKWIGISINRWQERFLILSKNSRILGDSCLSRLAFRSTTRYRDIGAWHRELNMMVDVLKHFGNELTTLSNQFFKLSHPKTEPLTLGEAIIKRIRSPSCPSMVPIYAQVMGLAHTAQGMTYEEHPDLSTLIEATDDLRCHLLTIKKELRRTNDGDHSSSDESSTSSTSSTSKESSFGGFDMFDSNEGGLFGFVDDDEYVVDATLISSQEDIYDRVEQVVLVDGMVEGVREYSSLKTKKKKKKKKKTDRTKKIDKQRIETENQIQKKDRQEGSVDVIRGPDCHRIELHPVTEGSCEEEAIDCAMTPDTCDDNPYHSPKMDVSEERGDPISLVYPLLVEGVMPTTETGGQESIGVPGEAESDDALYRLLLKAAETFKRSRYPGGVSRQMSLHITDGCEVFILSPSHEDGEYDSDAFLLDFSRTPISEVTSNWMWDGNHLTRRSQDAGKDP